jgi:uncharacterized membrane protein
MKRWLPALITGSFLLASATMASATTAFPNSVRIALGVLIVFVLPGFVGACGALPDRTLSWGERLLASVGLSLAIATCTAVLLAALPLGLSRKSFAVGLGGVTIALSIVAFVRIAACLSSDGARRDPKREVRT